MVFAARGICYREARETALVIYADEMYARVDCSITKGPNCILSIFALACFPRETCRIVILRLNGIIV